MENSAIGVKDLAEICDRAQTALLNSSFSEALKLSDDLTRMMDLCDVRPVVHSDELSRPYSILVVAHQPMPEHSELLECLIGLDASRFEIVVVENAALSIFDFPSAVAGRNVTVLRLGCNLGIGVARYLGFRFASGRAVICLDDDGLTTQESIESLISTFEQHRATVVRGRVLPRTPGSEVPPHYDLGNRIRCRFCDIEGMAMWDRQHVLQVGGFDPILYGHEGAELSARLYTQNGPEAFLYDPNAILWHDYASCPDNAAAKRDRYSKLNEYLKLRNPSYHEILNSFRRAERDLTSDVLIQTRRSYAMATGQVSSKRDQSVSVIATCWNGEDFIEDFVASLDRQTDRTFELVFVDDGSEDGSVAALRRLWPSDIPLRVIEAGKIGRAAALNRAIADASGEICLIADVDDVSLPQRVEWTREAYRRHPDADMIGFMIFDAKSHARAARPLPLRPTPLEVRCLFGMPCPFPAFTFRKERMRDRFNVDLVAGLDCDWLFRSILNDGACGMLVPLNLTYYRTHDQQITASKRDLQRTVSLDHVRRLHQTILGTNLLDERALEIFTGWEAAGSKAEYRRVHNYARQILRAVSKSERLHEEQVWHEVNRHLDAMHLGLVIRENAKIKALAEKHATEILKLKRKLDQTGRAKQDAEARARDAQKQLSLMLASRSWRLTASVRALGRWRKSLLRFSSRT